MQGQYPFAALKAASQSLAPKIGCTLPQKRQLAQRTIALFEDTPISPPHNPAVAWRIVGSLGLPVLGQRCSLTSIRTQEATPRHTLPKRDRQVWTRDSYLGCRSGPGVINPTLPAPAARLALITWAIAPKSSPASALRKTCGTDLRDSSPLR